MSLLLSSFKRPWEPALSGEAALTVPRENRAAGGVRRGGGPNSPNRDCEDPAFVPNFAAGTHGSVPLENTPRAQFRLLP